MTMENFPTEETLPVQAENPVEVKELVEAEAPLEAEAPQIQLSDAEIVRLVDQERGVASADEPESRTTFIAFGVTLVAFVYVAILVLNHVQSLEAARATMASTPFWIN